MLHKAVDLRFLTGTALEVAFQDGQVKRYDMARLFARYPQLQALQDRALFLSGRLMGAYGIIWNDELDVDAETIYEDGELVRTQQPANQMLAQAVAAARAACGLSQKQVADAAGMDQSDFSQIERGLANPSVSTLERIAKAMGGTLSVRILPSHAE